MTVNCFFRASLTAPFWLGFSLWRPPGMSKACRSRNLLGIPEEGARLPELWCRAGWGRKKGQESQGAPTYLYGGAAGQEGVGGSGGAGVGVGEWGGPERC